MFMQDLSNLIPSTLTALFPGLTGLVAGTLVERAEGWCPVEALAMGDRIQTLDGGLARVLGVDRRRLILPSGAQTLILPGGMLDACSDLVLLPGQHLLVDTLDDPIAEGAPFVMVAAAALARIDGIISRAPVGMIEVITPLLADEEAVYVNSGVLAHCPGIIDGAGRSPQDSFFPMVSGAEAQVFLRRRQARLAA